MCDSRTAVVDRDLVAVTLTYAAPGGHALIGRALYLPGGWAADDERRELAGVPNNITFETKPQLAGHLLQHAHDRGIRAAFVAGDEVYGGRDLRQSIRERGTGYVLAVRSNYMVTLPSGRHVTVRTPPAWSNPACGSGCAPARQLKGPGTPTPTRCRDSELQLP